METETEQNKREELRESVGRFLRRNFPQIAMHGGDAAIVGLDVGDRSVDIQLGGACSGCGISPMTVMAIKSRLTTEVDGIETVNVGTNLDDWGSGTKEQAGGHHSDAPF
jgi:Fe-S cluster biogenesis protein NfuA